MSDLFRITEEKAKRTLQEDGFLLPADRGLIFCIPLPGKKAYEILCHPAFCFRQINF